MAEEYLQEKVRNIVEPLISSLLKELPEDPMFFMYNWFLLPYEPTKNDTKCAVLRLLFLICFFLFSHLLCDEPFAKP